ncbi:MAG: alternate F1F0 ATPase, F1 subunit alpha [Elainellaceae cyanobacterium]
MTSQVPSLKNLLDQTFTPLDRALDSYQPQIQPHEIGMVSSVGGAIASVIGLPSVKADEILRFPGGVNGIAFNLDPDEIGVILLDSSEHIKVGQRVLRTQQVMNAPVGDGLLGRVLDATGRPLDQQGEIRGVDYRPIERDAPPFVDRAPVKVPLQTGIKAIDALIPIGRGQRELIVGDRQTGKTTIAVDTILNQADKDVICIYCAIGKRTSAVAKVISTLRDRNAMDYSIVIVSTGDDPPGLQYVTPYAATTMGEYFMEQGRDVLIIFDDLTRHAWAYRELSLLLRRPPGREAYPGDIFYIHSRMLERSTHLRDELGGGSLTTLPIVETQAQNISAYIPTNLISITDGQIYLSPDLFQQGILPPVDIGKSVSRVGGKTQLPAYKAVAGELRLSYSQFQEVEVFARFGTQLDEDTRQTLRRGRRVREILKQPQSDPIPVAEQIAVLLAVGEGIFDAVPLDDVEEAAFAIRHAVTDQCADLCDRIQSGESLSDDDQDTLLDTARQAVESYAHDDTLQNS